MNNGPLHLGRSYDDVLKENGNQVEASSSAIDKLTDDISHVNKSSRSLADMAEDLGSVVHRFRTST